MGENGNRRASVLDVGSKLSSIGFGGKRAASLDFLSSRDCPKERDCLFRGHEICVASCRGRLCEGGDGATETPGHEKGKPAIDLHPPFLQEKISSGYDGRFLWAVVV